jgi:hypothetical protein
MKPNSYNLQVNRCSSIYVALLTVFDFMWEQNKNALENAFGILIFSWASHMWVLYSLTMLCRVSEWQLLATRSQQQATNTLQGPVLPDFFVYCVLCFSSCVLQNVYLCAYMIYFTLYYKILIAVFVY